MPTVGSVQDYGMYDQWPENVVYVGMAGTAAWAYGIPGSAAKFGKPWELVNDPRGWPAAYIEYLVRRLTNNEQFYHDVKALKGKTILCWCTKKARTRGQEVACHARILAEFVDLLNGD